MKTPNQPTATRKRTTPRKTVKSTEPTSPLTLPFTIAIDNREQSPFVFTGIVGDASENSRELVIPTESKYLKTGDYSITRYEDHVCIERKSLPDLFSTLSSGRRRFEEEHARMAKFSLAVVLIESDWSAILNRPPEMSRLNPLIVYRTAISWMVRYGVQWMAVPGRRFAEITCYQILRKWYENRQEQEKMAGPNTEDV